MSCLTPITLRNEAYKNNPAQEYTHNVVPCGKCAKCLQKRSREWIFRILQELKISASAYFVTLTYQDSKLKFSESGIATLVKKDFQDYMKRLRKLQWQQNKDDLKIKYYACGEYGDQTHRPHYHAIILNSYPDLIEKAWTDPEDNEPIGIVHIGNVSQDSIAYNTKYILKGKKDWENSIRDDYTFQKQFSLMSKGLGANYMQKEVVGYHKKNLDQNYVVDEKGYKYHMPRYYANKMFTDKEMAKVKVLAKKYMEDLPQLDSKEDLESRQHKQYIHNKQLRNKLDKL